MRKTVVSVVTILVICVMSSAAFAAIGMTRTRERSGTPEELYAKIVTLALVQPAYSVISPDMGVRVAFEIAQMTWDLGRMLENEAYNAQTCLEQEDLLVQAEQYKIQALSIYDHVVHSPGYSGRVEALLEIAYALEEFGQSGPAAYAFAMVAESEPLATREQKAESFLAVGTYFVNEGYYARARAAFDTIIRDYADSRVYGWALYYIALSFEAEERWMDAAIWHDQVLHYSKYEANGRVMLLEDAAANKAACIDKMRYDL